jgi:hypothetical protein
MSKTKDMLIRAIKSGFEVLGAVSAASSLLDSAIGTIKRVCKAYERQKEVLKVLNSYDDELSTMKNILQIVSDEEALQTAAVASQLKKIKGLAERLNDCLQLLEPGTRGSMCQFTHQLVHGSAYEKALADIMDELGHAKSGLSLHIQVANVGLTQTVRDKLVVNAEVVYRVDHFLQQVLGEGQGLKIAMLLKDRPTQGKFDHASLVKILKVDRRWHDAPKQ